MTAFERGHSDAERGMTTCPYGLPECCARWAKGHDQAVEQGLGKLPRFGLIAKRR